MNTPNFSSTPFNNLGTPVKQPAALHDIIGPVSFFPFTSEQIALGVAVLFVLIGGIAWFIWRSRRQPPLTVQEAALKALDDMKKNLMSGSDHDFGISVSTLLRNYLGDVFGLAAPRQTTEEFLSSLHQQKYFAPAEQKALGDFLKQSDVLKFAQGNLQVEDRLALIVAAEQFVKSGLPT